tara:strand:- start:57 stop:227 length:171 start_codon:yes stop_codon:yes gene_type:complete
MEQFRRVAETGMSTDYKIRLALGLQAVVLVISFIVVADMVNLNVCIFHSALSADAT